jgi:hypothetical protein
MIFGVDIVTRAPEAITHGYRRHGLRYMTCRGCHSTCILFNTRACRHTSYCASCSSQLVLATGSGLGLGLGYVLIAMRVKRITLGHRIVSQLVSKVLLVLSLYFVASCVGL